MIKLNIYILHHTIYKSRYNIINNTIIEIKKICEKIGGYDVNIKFILENTDIDNTRIKYDKYPEDTNNKDVNEKNAEYNKQLSVLNENAIYNIEKHRKVLKIISEDNENTINLILEDDVAISTDYINNIEEVFRNLKDNKFSDWDILFTCLPPINYNDTIAIEPVTKYFKTLMNKSSYFIKKSICDKLYDYTNIIKFNYKIILSKFINDNPDLKIMFINKNIFLEGSKVGIFPTTINNNNFLFQNNNYINLINISNNESIKKEDIEMCEKIFNESKKQFISADIIHIMGIIYYKYGDYDKAEEYFNNALENVKLHNIIVNQNSEILNNTINIYQYKQSYLEECKNLPSKYSIKK